MQYNKEMAERVWKRVQGSAGTSEARPQEDPTRGLWEMILDEWQNSRIYQHLARQYSGKQREALLEMSRQERAHADCLKGIYALTTGKPPRINQVQPELGAVDQLLRRCYGRQMQSLARYEARCDDAEYGRVFRELAEQERHHCRLLLELLGTWDK